MRRSFFPASLSLLLCSALLSGCVVTNDYIAFDSKAAPSPQIKRYDGNEWASERAVMVAAEKTNNWQTVISVGNDVIAKNPTNVEARIYLARAFTKTGDPRQALRVLSFISGVDTAELRIERARALIALTDFEEAVKLLKPLTDGSDLQKLSAEDRRSAKSLAAVAYSMSKNYAAADKLYEELLAELDNPIIRYNYARSLYLEGRAEDSLAQLQPIIDQVPAAKPAAVAALMKLGRENDVRRLLKGELDDEKIEELTDRLTRQMAEFDNFRKRTEREKSQMYEIGAKDIIEKILPVIDNFERGLAAVPEESKEDPFVEGMEKIYKQIMTTLEGVGVKPIEAVGQEFNPDFHNAVMHVEDEEAGENIITEEFQKGYMYHDSVVRHSMVKVAN